MIAGGTSIVQCYVERNTSEELQLQHWQCNIMAYSSTPYEDDPEKNGGDNKSVEQLGAVKDCFLFVYARRSRTIEVQIEY